ncbi:MAG: hypothetical protein ABIR96_07300 [Bdellovibrionota bacterium]
MTKKSVSKYSLLLLALSLGACNRSNDGVDNVNPGLSSREAASPEGLSSPTSGGANTADRADSPVTTGTGRGANNVNATRSSEPDANTTNSGSGAATNAGGTTR